MTAYSADQTSGRVGRTNVQKAAAAVGIVMARTASGARTYLVVGGIVYLVLFLYGLLVGPNSAANFVPVNTADDILHLLLGIGMLGLGLAVTRRRSDVTATPGG